jgi:hypothetical protein
MFQSRAQRGGKPLPPKTACLLRRAPGPTAPHGQRLANRTCSALAVCRLAPALDHCAARYARAVASRSFSSLLAVEITSTWATLHSYRGAATHQGMATHNRTWGEERIAAELRVKPGLTVQKLGIMVSESTVAKYIRRHRRPPSKTWRTFLTNHASQILAADLFVVPTVTFRLLFVLVLLAHDRRRIVHVAVTAHPTAAWTAQQLRNAFQRTRRRTIYSTIAIRSLWASQPRSPG